MSNNNPIQKQELTSMNIAEEQLRKLKELFPEAFTEGLKVDWDKLRLTLGQSIDVGKERYGMNWPGKADCFKIIQQPSIATLIPARDESVDFDTTENLFIEGDNLEVLKLLQKSYLGKIKLIYIDPPYNTGKDFIYPDNYSESLETYLQLTNQVDSKGNKLFANAETDGRFHSKWLNMMFPRLFLAKNLLRQDGAIFISIDDSEYDNLKKICNEIFGEENYITTIVRRRRKSQANLSQNISAIHEYILCFSKSDQFQVNRLSDSIDADNYTNPDNDPRGPYVTMPCTNKGGSKYEIETPSGIMHLDEWRFKKETYDELFAANKIVFPKGGDGKPRYKLFLSEKLEKGVLPNTWWDSMASNQEATIELKELFDGKVVFENPKPVDLIKQIIKLGSSKGDIVLDFFAGSGTTGHAALDLSYSGDERNFILVQLPFDVDDNSEAKKMGFERISDLSAERLKRVINKFEKDQSLFKSEKSFGFKYFTLSNSNFKIWDSALEKEPEVIQAKLFEHIQHISPEAEQEAILYELLLKSGFELTTPIEKLTLAGLTVFSIAEGQLLICLEKELTHDCIKAMAEMQPTRVICLDEGFKGENADALKTNAVQIMKSKGVVNFRTI
jgi:adenine-specific DNA-methyltransferase